MWHLVKSQLVNCLGWQSVAHIPWPNLDPIPSMDCNITGAGIWTSWCYHYVLAKAEYTLAKFSAISRMITPAISCHVYLPWSLCHPRWPRQVKSCVSCVAVADGFANKCCQCKWSINDVQPIGLYHPLDSITNLKYKLLCFLTPNKKIIKKGTSFYPG
jgi:hypothetical protein